MIASTKLPATLAYVIHMSQLMRY